MVMVPTVSTPSALKPLVRLSFFAMALVFAAACNSQPASRKEKATQAPAAAPPAPAEPARRGVQPKFAAEREERAPQPSDGDKHVSDAGKGFNGGSKKKVGSAGPATAGQGTGTKASGAKPDGWHRLGARAPMSSSATLRSKRRAVGQNRALGAVAFGGSVAPAWARVQPACFMPTVEVAAQPRSVFWSTGAGATYSYLLGCQEQQQLPMPEQVRSEELLQSFRYGYASHSDDFHLAVDGAPSPTRAGYSVVRLGLRAPDAADDLSRPLQLTLVVELPKQGARLARMQQVVNHLLKGLDKRDRLDLVVYGKTARQLARRADVGSVRALMNQLKALPRHAPTAQWQAVQLVARLRELKNEPQLAQRIVWVAPRDSWWPLPLQNQVVKRLAPLLQHGVRFAGLAVGRSQRRSSSLARLAVELRGDFHAVESLAQAEVFFRSGRGLRSTAVAEALKLQMDFNPAVVGRYRLIGYERRGPALESALASKGRGAVVVAGQELTVLYEVQFHRGAIGDTIGHVRMAFRRPAALAPSKRQFVVRRRDLKREFRAMHASSRLAVLLSQLAEDLRGSPWLQRVDYGDWLARFDTLPATWRRRPDLLRLRLLVKKLSPLAAQRKPPRPQVASLALLELVGGKP